MLVLLLFSFDGTPATAQADLGCFDVELGPWSAIAGTHTMFGAPLPGHPDSTADSLLHATPSRVWLSPRSSTSPYSDGYQVIVPEHVLPTPHRFQSWSLTSDTLFLGFSTGFGGTAGRLVRNGGGWAGVAETRSDVVGRLRHGRPIRLDPVDCGAPALVSASADPRLLRRIDLATGEPLELGRRIPETIELEAHPTGAWTALVSATGSWANHDTVKVRLDPERVVQQIEIRYPDARAMSLVADSLRRSLPPTNWSERGALWSNRSTTVEISLADPWLIVLSDRRYYF